jgi:hypothetical protein
MIRTILTPKNTDLHLSIPEDYVGKQIEVLLYTTEEVEASNKNVVNNSLRGKLQLSSEQYKDFQDHVMESRKEWNRDI